MKKLLAAGLAVGMMVGGAGAVSANNSVTDPDNLADHPALYGLCMAWSNNGNGRENGNAGSAPPFQALQDAAGGEDEVADFCEGVRPSNGKGQGRQDESSAPNPVG